MFLAAFLISTIQIKIRHRIAEINVPVNDDSKLNILFSVKYWYTNNQTQVFAIVKIDFTTILSPLFIKMIVPFVRFYESPDLRGYPQESDGCKYVNNDIYQFRPPSLFRMAVVSCFLSFTAVGLSQAASKRSPRTKIAVKSM